MPQEEDERGGAIVHHSRCFGLAEQREIVLEVSRTMTAFAAHQIVFEIGVISGDRGERFDYRRAERCAAEVGVNDNTSAVDYGLNLREPQRVDGRANAAHNPAEVWDLFLCP